MSYQLVPSQGQLYIFMNQWEPFHLKQWSRDKTKYVVPASTFSGSTVHIHESMGENGELIASNSIPNPAICIGVKTPLLL